MQHGSSCYYLAHGELLFYSLYRIYILFAFADLQILVLVCTIVEFVDLSIGEPLNITDERRQDELGEKGADRQFDPSD